MRPEAPARIRIVQAPIGEAPLWVREAWVGLEIPALTEKPQRYRTSGVLTCPRTWLGAWWFYLFGARTFVEGYLVDSSEAIELLGFRQPLAAQWWRQNAAAFARPGSRFIFDSPACEKV